MESLEEFPTEILRHIFLCFERDDWKNVLQVCKSWYSLGTRVFVEVLIYKGTRLLQMKNYKRSLKYFDQVLHVVDLVSKREASPEDYKDKELVLSEEFVTKKCRVLNNKAVALMNLKKHDDAIQCLKDVLIMKPDHVKAMNNLGDNLNSLQRYEEAIEVFDKALEYDPNRLSVLYNKGNSYLHMKRFHEAIEWYDRAIVVQPKDVDSLGNKAIALYRLGCLNEAVKYFDEVLQYNSKDRIALRYKDFVSEELRKKQLQEVIIDLNSITSERKKEADLQKRPTPFTLGVLGGNQVGKSTLAIRMSTGNQAGSDQPNEVAPNQYRNTLEIDGEWYHVDVIDIAPPENSSDKQFAENVKKADGFLLVYSIINKDTLDAIVNLYKQVKKIKKDDAQFLLIGNKVDAKGDREVTYEKGKKLAEELKMEFVEASAKVPINVKFAETTLLKKMIKHQETLSAKQQQQAQQQVKRKDQPMTPTTEKRVKKVPCNIS